MNTSSKKANEKAEQASIDAKHAERKAEEKTSSAGHDIKRKPNMPRMLPKRK